jgi:hypothetical protein
MTDGTPSDEFTTPPMTREQWQQHTAVVERYRQALARIADTPYWEGTKMTRIARQALEGKS